MTLRSAALFCLFLAAAGCGQKGPLYLPGDPNQGRIVLPEELGGDEQGDGAEEPGQAPANAEPSDRDEGPGPQEEDPQEENGDDEQ